MGLWVLLGWITGLWILHGRWSPSHWMAMEPGDHTFDRSVSVGMHISRQACLLSAEPVGGMFGVVTVPFVQRGCEDRQDDESCYSDVPAVAHCSAAIFFVPVSRGGVLFRKKVQGLSGLSWELYRMASSVM